MRAAHAWCLPRRLAVYALLVCICAVRWIVRAKALLRARSAPWQVGVLGGACSMQSRGRFEEASGEGEHDARLVMVGVRGALSAANVPRRRGMAWGWRRAGGREEGHIRCGASGRWCWPDAILCLARKLSCLITPAVKDAAADTHTGHPTGHGECRTRPKGHQRTRRASASPNGNANAQGRREPVARGPRQ